MATEQDRNRLKTLNEQLRSLLGIASENGVYLYEGIRYNKRGYDDLVKTTRDEIRKIEKKLAPPSAPEQVASETTRRETLSNRADALSKQYDQLAAKLLDIQQALGKSKTIDEENNLRGWVSTIQRNLDQINRAVVSLRRGADVATPPIISVPSLNQAKITPSGRVTAAQPLDVQNAGVPASTTAPVSPATSMGVATALTAGQRGEAGIFQGLRAPEETAKEETETPPSDTSTETQPDITSPAPPGMPPGGAYVTDPATGQQVYLPPGIDFGALAAATQVPADWEKAAREMFGVWYDVFKNDPEMSAFLQRLMREPEMSDAMFQAELQKTNWWRTTNATARDFARRQVEDPATLNSEIMDRTSVLRQAALDRGLAVDDRSLNDAALKMVQFGFSQQTALNHLAQLTLGTATGPSSLVQGFFGQSVRELAANYGVPLSDATLMKWTGDIATGNQSLNSFEAYARDLAKNLYPSLANGYDRGLSFTQMTSPYAQVASRILDIPDSQIDFTDPKWAAAFTKRDEKGGQVQMTYGEWADYLRTTPSFGYEYTDEAISKAYNVVNDLAELFGRA